MVGINEQTIGLRMQAAQLESQLLRQDRERRSQGIEPSAGELAIDAELIKQIEDLRGDASRIELVVEAERRRHYLDLRFGNSRRKRGRV